MKYGTAPEQAFSQLVQNHLSLLLQKFKRYFTNSKDPQIAKEWIFDPFAFKPCEWTFPCNKRISCCTLHMIYLFYLYINSPDLQESDAGANT